MHSRRFIFLSLALIALMTAGCASQFQLMHEDLSVASAWPYARGTIASTGAVAAGTFTGHLDIRWEKRVAGKPSGPLTLQHGILAYPSVKRRIRFFDAQSGEYLGKLKTKAPSQSGLTLIDSVGYFSILPPRNLLAGIDMMSGDKLWQRPVKDASAGSIIVEDRLLIGSAGRLTAYDLSDGSPAWTFEVDDRFSAAASYGHGTVYQPGEGGTLYALSPDDGAERFRVKVDGPMVASVAVSDLVIAADMLGHVYGIDPDDGTIVWRTKLDGPVWTAPAVADGRVFVGHSGGEIVALSESDGRTLWRLETIEVVRASVMVVGEFVIAGTLGGDLYSLKATDGTVVDRRELKGAIATAPVTDGDGVYVATEDGYIICFGERNEQTQQVHK